MFGKRLREVRMARKMTQQRIADDVGLALRSYQCYEQGVREPSLEMLVKYIYDNIQYGEFNTKSDYCQECGFDGEIILNEDMEWECPQCHNKDHNKLNVTRRTCGYLGENFWNTGKTKEIKSRVLHL